MSFRITDADSIFLDNLPADRVYIGNIQVWTPGFTFNTQWKTDNPGVSPSNSIRLPLEKDGEYAFTVRWGDGTIELVEKAPLREIFTVTDLTQNLSSDNPRQENVIEHSYDNAGVKNLVITGKIEGWSFNNEGDRRKLLNVQSWGSFEPGNNGGYFYGCENMKIDAPDVINLENTTYMLNAFRDCSVLSTTNTFPKWDVSGITDMRFMFAGATNFNDDLSEWITGNVETTRFMFYDAKAFNQNIGGWNMINNKNMGYMFTGAESFNQNIGGWLTQNVDDIDYMFNGASSFNQNIGNWNIEKVTEIRRIFENSGLSTQIYSSILQGWASQTVQPNLFLDAGDIKYFSSASSARDTLINVYGWTINDGGQE
mgnify:CR=1 FL=1